MKADQEFQVIERVDGVSRWNELSRCVGFHAKMASRCWIPTQFMLLNESGVMPRKYSVCMSNGDEVKAEREYIIDSMNHIQLKERANPLAMQIRKLVKKISKDVHNLTKNNTFVAVTICTHGVPTDGNGSSSRQVKREFLDSLRELGNLPVRIVFRLTTDEEKVIEFYSSVDEKFSNVDVLDDFWGEAMEVYLHNPWLTYGIGIHRLREAGLGNGLWDLLDEKPFDLMEVREFCVDFFLGRNGLSLRNPNVHLSGFFEDLQNTVEKEKLVWNPLKNRLTPWIDMEKLRLMTKRNESKNKSNRPTRHVTSDDQSERPKVSPQSDPTAMNGSTTSDQKPNSRGNRRYASSVQTPGVRYKADPPASNGHGSPNRKPKTAAVKQSSNSGPKDLEDAIKQWSHIAPGYFKLKPMQDLLIGLPELFPPNNAFVESHEHFLKWKEFSADAFIGEGGDELKALLKRASRKSKLFFHPDKIPNDCTPRQETLFKSMWEILQESESKTFELAPEHVLGVESNRSLLWYVLTRYMHPPIAETLYVHFVAGIVRERLNINN